MQALLRLRGTLSEHTAQEALYCDREILAGAHHKGLSTDNVPCLRLDPHCPPVWVFHDGVRQQVLREECAHIIVQCQLPNQIPCPAQRDRRISM